MSIVEIGWILKVALDEIAGVLILSLRHPVDRPTLLLGEPRETRLRHGLTHRVAIEFVRVQFDDIDFVFAGVEKSAYLLVVGLRLSP